MLRWVREIVGGLIVAGLSGYVIRKLPKSLVDNAVTSYIDNKIGASLGLSEVQVDGLLSEWALPIVIGVLAMAVWHRWASAGLVKTTSQFQDSAREIDLSEALFWVCEKSAWGRWQRAQHAGPANDNEANRLREAYGVIWKASIDGYLVLRGRLKNSLEYVTIARDFWRSVSLEAEPNNAAISKATVHVHGDIAIPEYDNFIVDRDSVEVLWPRYQWKYYLPTLVLKTKAILKRKPRSMPDIPEKNEEQSTPISGDPEMQSAPISEPISESEPQSVPAIQLITPSPAAPEGWEKLFAVGDNGRSIWLRFLPDTKLYRADTLILVVYGQKILRDVSRIEVEAAHAAVEKTIHNAPNRQSASTGFLATISMLGQIQAAANRDWVDECVPRLLERVGLAQGGFYQLTDDGERRAVGLAYDLIRRA